MTNIPRDVDIKAVKDNSGNRRVALPKSIATMAYEVADGLLRARQQNTP